MRNNIIIIVLTAGCIYAGCRNESDKARDIALKVVETETWEGPARAVAEIGIEGMTCETGCARMIGKTLRDLTGVETAEVNFSGKTAHVEYNPEVLTEEEIIRSIEKSGKYVVTSADIKKTVLNREKVSAEDRKAPAPSTRTVENVREYEGFSFPNIFDAFTRLYSL